MQTQALIEKNVAVGAPPYAILAITAPLGDLDALARILSDLPAGFRLPIVVALLGPARAGDSMTELPARLQPRTALPVRWLGHRVPLRPGTVSLCMPGDAMIVGSDGVGQRLPATATGPMRSAKTLLGSIADSHGERALALVLGGPATDDACGIRSMKASGATVLALDEAVTRTWGPARAAAGANAFDLVLPLGRIASTLVRISVATRRSSGTGAQRSVGTPSLFTRERGTPYEVAAVRRAMERVLGALDQMCPVPAVQQPEVVSPTELAARIAGELRPLAAEAGRSLSVDCPASLETSGVTPDTVSELARRQLMNVLPASGGHVEVRVTVLRLFVQIVVVGERAVGEAVPRALYGRDEMRVLHAFVRPLRGHILAKRRTGRVEVAVWLPRVGAPDA